MLWDAAIGSRWAEGPVTNILGKQPCFTGAWVTVIIFLGHRVYISSPDSGQGREEELIMQTYLFKENS